MVAFIIYWAAIIACIAWGVLSIWFSVFIFLVEKRKSLGFCVLQRYRYYRLSNCFISLQNLGFRYLNLLKSNLYNFSFFRCIDCSSSYFRS